MKNTIIRGTIVLTIAGVITRLIGFYYRIFLSNAIGAEGMGLYQLVFPVAGLGFAICVSGIQTAIAKFVAANKNSSKTLIAGTTLSLLLSVLFTFAIFFNSHFVAERILLNAECEMLIKILVLSIPLSCVHSCINGYYIGLEKTRVPAFSQLFEQIIRVASVYVLIYLYHSAGKGVTPLVAMYGLVFGEIASVIYCLLSLVFAKHFHFLCTGLRNEFKKIVGFSVPLTANRILMALLQSGEAILIPAQLRVFGMSNSEALSIYGVLTGMALPIILFPSTLINSASTMILPSVSKAQSTGAEDTISKTISSSLEYCITLGIFCTGMFVFYGARAGSIIFHNDSVAHFIFILAWLCPFLYIATTMGSILNGLGKTTATSTQNTIGILIRILFIIFLTKYYGINAYLWSLLISQVYVSGMHLFSIRRMYKISFHFTDYICKPVFSIAISIGISLILFRQLAVYNLFSEIVQILIGAGIATALFFLFQILYRKDPKRA